MLPTDPRLRWLLPKVLSSAVTEKVGVTNLRGLLVFICLLKEAFIDMAWLQGVCIKFDPELHFVMPVRHNKGGKNLSCQKNKGRWWGKPLSFSWSQNPIPQLSFFCLCLGWSRWEQMSREGRKSNRVWRMQSVSFCMDGKAIPSIYTKSTGDNCLIQNHVCRKKKQTLKQKLRAPYGYQLLTPMDWESSALRISCSFMWLEKVGGHSITMKIWCHTGVCDRERMSILMKLWVRWRADDMQEKVISQTKGNYS